MVTGEMDDFCVFRLLFDQVGRRWAYLEENCGIQILKLRH
jgi:hypothetical protein